MKHLRIAALLAATLLPSAALAEITVTDVEGREVTLPGLPERIVLGFYFEDYIAVGGPEATDRLVGLSRFPWASWRPNQFAAYEKVIPRIGEMPDVGYAEEGDFSAEKVIALRPDLLLLAAGDYKSMSEAVTQIENAGIPVVTLDYNAQTVERHIASTLALGKVLGTEDRAGELARNYEEAMADIHARIAASTEAKGKKVYVELAKAGPSEIGNSYSDTMWGALIDSLGGQNIADGQISNWGPLSPEYMLAQQPELICLGGSDWQNASEAVTLGLGAGEATARERMAAYLSRPGWSELPAVREGRVYDINHGGARTLADYTYVQFIAKQLYPETFADVDPQANLRDFYAKWLPINAGGTFMLSIEE
ncbi:ABC transporter substrate-binding protein [uncultured Paracoccus sp.]|uniref:ABC transporter substrate-binding protein n=1 Tax=uncultured Paracoccus sp. TaxID=189685 RepID=UPI0025E9A15D|nr:ABC transporter substrate-binding protein [uncultured Paracoccus sp.]